MELPGKMMLLLCAIPLYSCLSHDNLLYIIIPEESSQSLPGEVVHRIPYIAQNDYKSCATTSAAMAISCYEGLFDAPLDKEETWKLSGSDEATVRQFGNDMEGLKKIADSYGYKSEYAEDLSIYDLEYLLSKNILMILNIRVRPDENPTHAILATGYNRPEQLLYVEDPAEKNRKAMAYDDLSGRWKAFLSKPWGLSVRSAFIIYPYLPILYDCGTGDLHND